VPLVLLIAVGELSSIPFMSHHGRKQILFSKIMIICFFTTTPIAAFFFRRYVWDLVFFWLTGYTVASWTVMTPAERRQAREAVRAADAKLVADEIARHESKAAR